MTTNANITTLLTLQYLNMTSLNRSGSITLILIEQHSTNSSSDCKLSRILLFKNGLLTTALLIFLILTVKLSIAAPHQVDTGISAPELVGQATWCERKHNYKTVTQLRVRYGNYVKPLLRNSTNFTSRNQLCFITFEFHSNVWGIGLH